MNKPIRVLLCDSGISERLTTEITVQDIGYGVIDANGHGTAAAEMLLRCSGGAQISSVRILDEHCACDVGRLLAALEGVCGEADLICLPLALDTQSDVPELHTQIQRLHHQGRIVVSALYNRRTYSLPAVYPEVIGTAAAQDTAPGTQASFYCRERAIQAIFPVDPVISAHLPGMYRVLGGNSLTCSLMTAHIARMMALYGIGTLQELEARLCRQTVSEIMGAAPEVRICAVPEDSAVMQTLRRVAAAFGVKESRSALLPQFTSKSDVFAFLARIQEELGCINRRTMMRLSDLVSLSALYQYCITQEAL